MSRVGLLAVSLALTACANGVHHTELGDVEVVTIRQRYNNAHLVRLPEGNILVDAGLERDAPELGVQLERAGIAPGELDLVVLTHGHADHAGGAAWLQANWGTPVLAGAGDLLLMESGHNDVLCPTDATARLRLDQAQAETYSPVVPDHVIREPFDLSALGLAGRVIPVTGHTEGSLVLVTDEALFAGDLVRGGITSRAATTHFFQCDPQQAVRDLKALLQTSEADTWFVGHFGPIPRSSVQSFTENP